MANKTGPELFIVDNSDADWKVLRYLHDWCQIAKGIDIATGYFEIGSLLALKDEWQKVDHIRLLMGDEVSKRTKTAFENGLQQICDRLDASLENEKQKNDFLTGVPAIVESIRSGKIQYKVYAAYGLLPVGGPCSVMAAAATERVPPTIVARTASLCPLGAGCSRPR